MNRLEACFAELGRNHDKALVGFVVAGDPSPPVSFDLVRAMCGAGLDVLELGIPFSDPTADGPVIQRAAGRALQAGASLARALEMTARLRECVETPVILFSYYNPIFAYGLEPFCRDAVTAGADGVLVVDLPPEESRELTRHFRKDDEFALIRLAAPTTPPERMKRIVADAAGFLYLISKTGVTGSAGIDTASVHERIRALRGITELPVCVGFGIADCACAAALAPVADGVVIGTAFQETIEARRTAPDLVRRIETQVREFKAALATPPRRP